MPVGAGGCYRGAGRARNRQDRRGGSCENWVGGHAGQAARCLAGRDLLLLFLAEPPGFDSLANRQIGVRLSNMIGATEHDRADDKHDQDSDPGLRENRRQEEERPAQRHDERPGRSGQGRALRQVFTVVLCKLQNYLGSAALLVIAPHQVAHSTRLRKRAKPARPYIMRLKTFSRLTCPSTGPLLHGHSKAAATAA